MSASTYMLKCNMRPPSVVYIKDKKSDNEFCIEITKVPVTYEEYVPSHNELLMTTDSASPVIYVKVDLGEGIGDLCTATQAANMTFTTVEGDGWSMEWLSNSQCFVIYPPSDFDFPDEYSAAFRSDGFYTNAKEGTVTFEAFIKNFPDVENQIAYASLTKRYPIIFDSYTAKPDIVNLGDSIILSWRVLNAKKCFLMDSQGMKQVDTEDSKSIVIKKPERFYLSAENDMGMTNVKEQDVQCIKPTIEFSAEPEYYHPGCSVTLKWHATSAESVLISPDLGEMPLSGEREYFPESPYLTASANGYDGFERFTAIKSLTLKKTPWKREGIVSGIDLSKDTLNTDRRISEWNGQLYLFCDKTLYRSSDGLEWGEVSTIDLGLDMTLGAYSTVIVNDTFIVLGIKKEGSKYVQVASCDLNSNEWEFGDAVVDTNAYGGILTNVVDIPYYAWKTNDLIFYYSPNVHMNNEWTKRFYTQIKGLECFDITSTGGMLYCAGYSENKEQLSVYLTDPEDPDWKPIGNKKMTAQKWLCLIRTMNEKFILTKDMMLYMDNYRKVSNFHPQLEDSYRPWTGSRNNAPVLITRDGTLWSCNIEN